MSDHSPQWSEELGAYLVGALEPEDAERMRRHLDECAQCRADYAELAPVIGILATIPAEALADDEVPSTVAPDEAMWERLRARAGFEPGPDPADPPVRDIVRWPPLPNQHPVASRPAAWGPVASGPVASRPAASGPAASGPAASGAGRPRRRYRRPMRPSIAAAISGVLVAAAAVGVFASVHTSGAGTGAGTTATATAAGVETVSAVNAADGVSATVQYRPVDWGSWVQITLKGVKPGEDCVLYAANRAGERAVASTWWAPPTPGESSTVPGGVAVQAADIASFQVADSAGKVLLTIPVS